jgi:C-terminal processing protease CtpA/Prc
LQKFGNGRIGYADLPDSIGYLRVIAFAGYAEDGHQGDLAELTRALDAIFSVERSKAWRGLIIDLRINGGATHQHTGLHRRGVREQPRLSLRRAVPLLR